MIVWHYPRRGGSSGGCIGGDYRCGLEVTQRVVEVAAGVVVMALVSGVSVVAMVVMVPGGVKVNTSVDSEELMAGLTSSAVAVVSISLVVE